MGDPDFKGPRRLVESEPDVARVVLKPGRDTFVLLGRLGRVPPTPHPRPMTELHSAGAGWHLLSCLAVWYFCIHGSWGPAC